MAKIKFPIIEQIKGKFVDIMALFVALAAFIISIRQANVQEKLEIVNKQPLLTIEFIKVDAAQEKGFLLQNVGFGPAIIKSFKFYANREGYVKGISYQQWLDSNNKARFEQDSVIFSEANNLTGGYVITTNPQTPLFLLKSTARSFINSLTALNMHKIIIEIEYRSMNPFDNNIYYLRYCEQFVNNNIRDRAETSQYEYDAKES